MRNFLTAWLRSLFLCLAFLGLLPRVSLALTPITLFQDLVAGEGEPGFEDGPFYSAQFNFPVGLALNGDGSILYVADQKNNRVRFVSMDQDNEVGTLAGTGEAGKKNGVAAQASFNAPTVLALLPGNQLGVMDQGNYLLRGIDLKTGAVTTLAGNGQPGVKNGAALQAGLGRVWAMAYFSPDHALYFSQPEDGLLRRWDPDKGRVETILQNNTLVPHPAALCVAEGILYVADRDLPSVYEMKALGKMSDAPVSQKAEDPTPTPVPVVLQAVGQGDHVIALAGIKDLLYAYQTGGTSPILRLFPDAEPVTFISPLAEGENRIDKPATALPHFRNGMIAGPVGFAPDPRSLKRFFVANPACNIIASFRDLRIFDLGPKYLYNSGGVVDFDYPLPKPNRTFRILMLGRSYLSYVIKNKYFPLDANNADPVAKRLEITLNTEAALNSVPRHFEVFNMSTIQEHQLYVWPCYLVPPAAKAYDADMALLMMDPGSSLESYFFGPLTAEGIPPKDKDPEFMLKSFRERFKSGPVYDLFKICEEKKILVVGSDGQLKAMPTLDQMAADPQIREKLIQVVGRPLEVLNEKMKSEKTGEGVPRRFVFCFFPNADVFSNFTPPSKTQRNFWKQLCQEKGIPFLDLSDDFIALRLSFFPFSEEEGMDHFDGNGHKLFDEILAHELIQQKIIPFEPEKSLK